MSSRQPICKWTICKARATVPRLLGLASSWWLSKYCCALWAWEETGDAELGCRAGGWNVLSQTELRSCLLVEAGPCWERGDGGAPWGRILGWSPRAVLWPWALIYPEAVEGCCSRWSDLCRPVRWLEEAGLGRETCRGEMSLVTRHPGRRWWGRSSESRNLRTSRK